jgi:glycosyltransferase involved in cell wall biosynthesis
MFRIIVNCGPCESYIKACLESIRTQTFSCWNAYVTVDPCGDRTVENALAARAGDPRIHIESNTRQLYSMENLIRAIERSRAAPEDIVVVLDGDDWFASPEALAIIDETYRTSDCWMTYGTWIGDDPHLEGMRRGLWPPYPDETSDFRNSEWLGTAVRTWKRWLWDLIDDRDFRDADGNYFRVTEDQAVMVPMLEMSGTARAKHIVEVLMVYNRTSPHACGLTRCEEMLANSRYIMSRPPYSRLAERPTLVGKQPH